MVSELAARLAELRHAERLHVFLGYDGTLVPVAPLPSVAAPDTALRELLLGLALRPGTRVHLVSSRSRAFLDEWFGRLPLALYAEHGFWTRPVPGRGWAPALEAPPPWREQVIDVLGDVAARTPGSQLEPKTGCVAWHYCGADAELARDRLEEARSRLEALQDPRGFALIDGAAVLEVRLRAIHEGRAVATSIAEDPSSAVLAAGDDAGDEPLFAALPERAVTIHVGARRTRARFRVASPEELRTILLNLLGR